MAGISQPHVHNVLKGARTLSPEFIDAILKSLNCSALDVCTPEELREQLQQRSSMYQPTFELPFLLSGIGPGECWGSAVDLHDRNPVPCYVRNTGEQLVLARLGPDLKMKDSIAGNNIAAVDLSELDIYCPDSIYVVDRGQDVMLRRIRPGRANIYLAADTDLEHPARWEPVAVDSVIVRARVCWLGVETPRAARAEN